MSQVPRATWGCQEGGGRGGVSPRSLSLVVSFSLPAALEPRGESPHLEVKKGQSLRLLCAADSLPLATLSWTLQDRVLSWSHPLGSTTLELVLPGVKAEDAGRYTCRAENRLGFLSRSLDLSVRCECDRQGMDWGASEEARGLGAESQGSAGTWNPRPMELKMLLPALTGGAGSGVPRWGRGGAPGFSPHHRATLPHQWAVLQLNSVLILSTWRESQLDPRWLRDGAHQAGPAPTPAASHKSRVSPVLPTDR